MCAFYSAANRFFLFAPTRLLRSARGFFFKSIIACRPPHDTRGRAARRPRAIARPSAWGFPFVGFVLSCRGLPSPLQSPRRTDPRAALLLFSQPQTYHTQSSRLLRAAAANPSHSFPHPHPPINPTPPTPSILLPPPLGRRGDGHVAVVHRHERRLLFDWVDLGLGFG